MSPDFIDMTGQTIGQHQVIDYAPARGRRAHWWVMCLDCRHQQAERGCNLRKALRGGDWRLICKGCEG